MSLVKCEFCRSRVYPARLALHHKHCIQRRRKLKAGTLEQPEIIVEQMNPEDILITPGTQELKLIDKKKKKKNEPKAHKKAS